MAKNNTPMPTTNSMDKLFKLQIWVRRLISFLFAIFLMGLSASIMKDINNVENTKTFRDYVGVEYKQLDDNLLNLRDKQKELRLELAKAQDHLTNKKNQTSSYQMEFNNWTALRTATENNATNPEVRERLATLDNKRNSERESEASLFKIQQNDRTLTNNINEQQIALSNIQKDGQDKANYENKKIALKIFGFRLLFSLPILLLGVFVFTKYRTHQYSPLVWGYTWFSVYVFFFGLVPYLPSFGGYIRYLVGIVLVIFGGIYAIKNFNTYMEKRQKELERDKSLRASQIDSNNAIVAFKNHVCPSCGQDYSVSGDIKDHNHNIRHCFHCGLELFKKCECGKVNFAFFSFCSSCGKNIKHEDKN